MPIISAYCRKGGVGKTTIVSYLAHYYATKGNTVLIISADDQNSVFKVFGVSDKIEENFEDFFEHLLIGKKYEGDILIEAREDLYLIKTLNTDQISMQITLDKTYEKKVINVVKEYAAGFDYVFIDFPPSGCRLTEVLLDMSDEILVVVGLDSLGVDGFFNTIQYFVDKDLDLDKVKYVIPNGFAKNKRAPQVSLKLLETQVKDYTKKAVLLPPLREKSIIKNLQSEGWSVFDKEDELPLKHYDKDMFEELKTDLLEIYDKFKFKKVKKEA